jgi:hypothetical protein
MRFGGARHRSRTLRACQSPQRVHAAPDRFASAPTFLPENASENTIDTCVNDAWGPGLGGRSCFCKQLVCSGRSLARALSHRCTGWFLCDLLRHLSGFVRIYGSGRSDHRDEDQHRESLARVDSDRQCRPFGEYRHEPYMVVPPFLHSTCRGRDGHNRLDGSGRSSRQTKLVGHFTNHSAGRADRPRLSSLVGLARLEPPSGGARSTTKHKTNATRRSFAGLIHPESLR